MPMTLLQRLPGLQKAPGVRNGLSYLMDGARNLFAVVGDFNVHHKIPLDFFRELHILTVRKLMFPFFEPNLFPLLEGGGSFFISPRKEDRPVMQRNYICIKRFASCCSRIQYIN